MHAAKKNPIVRQKHTQLNLHPQAGNTHMQSVMMTECLWFTTGQEKNNPKFYHLWLYIYLPCNVQPLSNRLSKRFVLLVFTKQSKADNIYACDCVSMAVMMSVSMTCVWDRGYNVEAFRNSHCPRRRFILSSMPKYHRGMACVSVFVY